MENGFLDFSVEWIENNPVDSVSIREVKKVPLYRCNTAGVCPPESCTLQRAHIDDSGKGLCARLGDTAYDEVCDYREKA